MENKIPNPGSDEAINQGCTCAVLDNGHGRLNNGKGPFWIHESCPVHTERGKEWMQTVKNAVAQSN